MILHFVIDGKLTDQFIDNFLSVSDKNYFLVFGTDQTSDFKRITRKGDFLSAYNEKEDDINNIIHRLDAKAIILHSLSYEFARTVNKIKSKIPICWAAWGYDVYNLPRIEPQIYGPKTNKFLLTSNPGTLFKRMILKDDFLRKWIFDGLYTKDNQISTIYEAHKHIDFFMTFIEDDYKLFSKFYQNDFTFLYATFSSIDQYLAGYRELTVLPDAENILLGNSFSPSSNYLDALPVISKVKCKLRRVYVVLSYGINEKHRLKVLSTGRKVLSNKFCPILDFIPRADYIRLLQTCSTGIFNHYRQQAMGNIIAMLYMGSRVYLSIKNPAYSYFLRNGIKVYCFEKDFTEYGISRLGKDIVNKNRLQLDSIFDKNKVLTDIRKITEVLTNI